MPEFFPNNPYFQDGVEPGPRMGTWDRFKEKMKTRVTEPYKGLFENVIGDNFRAVKRGIKEVFAPEEERDEKGVPRGLLPALGWHAVSCFQRTMGAVFSPVSQLFGQGVGEFLNWKFDNVITRTGVGAWTSPVFAKDAVKEAWSFVKKPFSSGWNFVTQLGEDVFDNLILGGARMTISPITGLRADSLEWQSEYEPPRPQTPWSRLSHTNLNISNREAHLDRDLRNVARRDRYKLAIDDAVLQPPRGNPWAIPHEEIVTNMSAANLYETSANNNKWFQSEPKKVEKAA